MRLGHRSDPESVNCQPRGRSKFQLEVPPLGYRRLPRVSTRLRTARSDSVTAFRSTPWRRAGALAFARMGEAAVINDLGHGCTFVHFEVVRTRADSLPNGKCRSTIVVDVKCSASTWAPFAFGAISSAVFCKETGLLCHSHNRFGTQGCRTVLGLTAGRARTFTVLTLLLTITTIAQEVPARPAPPTLSAPAVQQRSLPSEAPKEHKVHWAELSWKPSPTKGIVGYYVYRAVAGHGAKPQRITAHPVKGTRYRDTKVNPGTTYIYSLAAVQRINSRLIESDRTPPLTARIPSP
jgi:hypothetical protein